jgi:hypothetical protein
LKKRKIDGLRLILPGKSLLSVSLAAMRPIIISDSFSASGANQYSIVRFGGFFILTN